MGPPEPWLDTNCCIRFCCCCCVTGVPPGVDTMFREAMVTIEDVVGTELVLVVW